MFFFFWLPYPNHSDLQAPSSQSNSNKEGKGNKILLHMDVAIVCLLIWFSILLQSMSMEISLLGCFKCPYTGNTYTGLLRWNFPLFLRIWPLTDCRFIDHNSAIICHRNAVFFHNMPFCTTLVIKRSHNKSCNLLIQT